MSSIEPRTFAVGARSATVRSALEADAAEILALRIATAAETEFLGCEPDEIRTTTEEHAAFLSRKLSSPFDLYILAELDSRIVGLTFLEGSPLRRFGHGVKLGLAVSRDSWGQGLGKALVQAALDWADAQRIVRVALEVVETNLTAVRLYESLGFEHEGLLRARRRHGDRYLDDHIMARVRR
jgi:RimJ/RimL family protein N-acetyltransferase